MIRFSGMSVVALGAIIAFAAGLAHRYWPSGADGDPPNPNDVRICEEIVRAMLDDPTTYLPIRMTETKYEDAADVGIEFEAANAFGVSFQHRADCHVFQRRPSLTKARLDGQAIKPEVVEAVAKARRADLN
jgi:hypothetical protein